ncbi:MAG: helix-turn-helix domain-containing protein [Lachnotalea sp.]
MFNNNLKKVMNEKGYTVTKLSTESNIGKSSISQYLSGKNIPTPERIEVLANTLGCSVEELATIEIEPTGVITPLKNQTFNVPVPIAAKLMGKSNDFVYEGLKQGIFPFGYAVKMSSVYTFFISSTKFTECTGIPVVMNL